MNEIHIPNYIDEYPLDFHSAQCYELSDHLHNLNNRCGGTTNCLLKQIVATIGEVCHEARKSKREKRKTEREKTEGLLLELACRNRNQNI